MPLLRKEFRGTLIYPEETFSASKFVILTVWKCFLSVI